MSFFINIDSHIENFFLSIRNPLGLDFFAAVTWLGEWKILIFVVILAVAVLWIKNKKEYILPFLTTVVGAGIFGQIAKIIFERARPIGNSEMGDPFSFPSGHALIALAFYGFWIYFFRQNATSRFKKSIYLASGVLLVLLIGVSRLYLDMHFFSDVVGGFLFGAIWLAIGIYIHKKNSRTGKI